jgi:hypothetical protein
MLLIRRRLIAVVLAVVAGMLAGLVATPAAICQMGVGTRVASAQLVCTCGHGADAQCAMHPHHGKGSSPASSSSSSSSPSSSSSTNRWCAGCPDSVEMTVTALVGFAAPVVDRYQTVVPDGTSESLPLFGSHPLDAARPPVSPPPRG